MPILWLCPRAGTPGHVTKFDPPRPPHTRGVDAPGVDAACGAPGAAADGEGSGSAAVRVDPSEPSTAAVAAVSRRGAWVSQGADAGTHFAAWLKPSSEPQSPLAAVTKGQFDKRSV